MPSASSRNDYMRVNGALISLTATLIDINRHLRSTGEINNGWIRVVLGNIEGITGARGGAINPAFISDNFRHRLWQVHGLVRKVEGIWQAGQVTDQTGIKLLALRYIQKALVIAESLKREFRSVHRARSALVLKAAQRRGLL